jgi:hypothetical protein
MKCYLITPVSVLGSDSFHVSAISYKHAVLLALEQIEREDWHSPDGWAVYEQCGTFEDKQ